MDKKKFQFKIKKYAVIGDPVTHSLSPLIQQAAFNELKIAAKYIKIQVREKQLKTFFNRQAKRLAGFNITVPLKEKAFPFLDWIAPKAKLIGAVNTVVCQKNQLFGFNTDGEGYLLSLPAKTQEQLHHTPTLMIGAGGAARAICAALLQKGVSQVYIVNRHLERAEKIKIDFMHFAKKQKINIETVALQDPKLKNYIQKSGLIINTTRIGLNQTRFENFPWNSTQPKTLISDIVYNPLITPFLKEAKKRKLPIHTGEGMLVYQGALAFQLWTGTFPNIDLMKKVMLAHLKK